MGRDVWAGLEQLGTVALVGWGRDGWVGRLREPASSSLSLGAEEALEGTLGSRASSLAVC